MTGSIKRGWITPSLLISRLRAQSPKTPLAAALQEYGRLVRTNFALAYHAGPLQQRRITAMLNKGETTNTLRRRIAFANRPPGSNGTGTYAKPLQSVGVAPTAIRQGGVKAAGGRLW